MFSFKTFFEQGHKHELDLLRAIPNMSMYDQAVKDQEIHKKAIGNGSFSNLGNKFLSNDIDVKEIFKKILKQKENNELIDLEEKNNLIKMLKRDRTSHDNYLDDKDFSSHTGSSDWHKMWISIYNKWIDWLENL